MPAKNKVIRCLFIIYILYSCPASLAQLDKQYQQQQNSNAQEDAKKRNFCKQAKEKAEGFYGEERPVYFVAKINGVRQLINWSCDFRKVLGKTYKGSDWSELYKIEGGTIIRYYQKYPTSLYGGIKREIYARPFN
jgi:hypothetical protein